MTASGNVGVAFALVIGAGLSTTIGACAAFFAKLASPKTLALGLGLSAGVMMYVSFVEIFMQKGIPALEDGGWDGDTAYRWGTAFFFSGMVITAMLDGIVHIISKFAGENETLDATKVPEVRASTSGTFVSFKNTSPSAVPDIEAGKDNNPPSDNNSEESASNTDNDNQVHLTHVPGDMPEEAARTVDTYVSSDSHQFGLQKMGVLTAVAIGIHNLPEGLATFIAALSDPLNGLAIAVAIALHNIPEGVCVAMPVYYATGSRVKGFMWAFLSGISEPIGGLLGYLVLYGNRMSDTAYGVLFCIVGGMMTFISLVQLVPTALKFDPHNHVTSKSIIAGMIIMAASLLMFTI